MYFLFCFVFRMWQRREKTPYLETAVIFETGIGAEAFDLSLRGQIARQVPVADIVAFGCDQLFHHGVHFQITQIRNQLGML